MEVNFIHLFQKKKCPDAKFVTTTTETGYDFNLLVGGKAGTTKDLKYDDKYWQEPNADNWDELSKKTQQNIKACAWSNQFAFPWEIGMYWNLTVGGAGKRAMGRQKNVLLLSQYKYQDSKLLTQVVSFA